MADNKSEMLEVAKVLALEIAKALKPSAGEPKLRKHQGLAEEHKGTKTYMVGPSKHYRGGRTYLAGELVTVTNERPAKDWKLVENGKVVETGKAPPVVAPTIPGRASDRSVG